MTHTEEISRRLLECAQEKNPNSELLEVGENLVKFRLPRTKEAKRHVKDLTEAVRRYKAAAL